MAGLVIFLFGRFERAIENEVDHVRQGETVNGISLLVPFVDVRAARAKVTWLGDEQREPMALRSPHLLYLGRGDKVAVFVECGHTTVIVPADAVAIHLLDRGTGNADEVQRREAASSTSLWTSKLTTRLTINRAWSPPERSEIPLDCPMATRSFPLSFPQALLHRTRSCSTETPANLTCPGLTEPSGAEDRQSSPKQQVCRFESCHGTWPAEVPPERRLVRQRRVRRAMPRRPRPHIARRLKLDQRAPGRPLAEGMRQHRAGNRARTRVPARLQLGRSTEPAGPVGSDLRTRRRTDRRRPKENNLLQDRGRSASAL
jgi:hypothetical protein